MSDSGSQTLSLSQSQRLTTRLSQQQLRFVRLLELNEPEFEEAVDQELQSNPALEVIDKPDIETGERSDDSNIREDESLRPGWSRADSSSPSVSFNEIPAPEDSPSLYEHLIRQLNEKHLDPEVSQAAKYIIGSLDSNGYLRIPISQLSLDMAVNEGVDLPENIWKEALERVQELDPAGVGAESLEEMLLIQARRLPDSPEKQLALRILENYFQPFVLKHFDRIASSLRLPLEEVSKGIELIRQLNPKPGAQYETRVSTAGNYVIPDFVLDESDSGLTISLSNRVPELAIEQSFARALDSLKKQPASKKRKTQGYEYISDRVGEARDFIKILSQRQQTLLTVASAILKIQKEYFETRDVYRLRPMGLKDIMAVTGFDASVVSRATAGKYIQTPWGIFPMRFFFSDTVGENGSDTDALTNRKLEAEIRDLIEKEDKKHPMSDDKLQKAMTERGYDISRRTVAKYRDRLGIPVARLRRHDS